MSKVKEWYHFEGGTHYRLWVVDSCLSLRHKEKYDSQCPFIVCSRAVSEKACESSLPQSRVICIIGDVTKLKDKRMEQSQLKLQIIFSTPSQPTLEKQGSFWQRPFSGHCQILE